MKSILLRKKHNGGEVVDLCGDVKVNDDDDLAPENIHEEQMEKCNVKAASTFMLQCHANWKNSPHTTS